MSKSPEMEKFLDKMAQRMFGRARNGQLCVSCGSVKIEPTDFRDELSRREYKISQTCQECQDKVFGQND